MKRPQLLDTLNQPWALVESKLMEIRAIYLRHLGGEKIDLAALEDKLGEPLNKTDERFTVHGDVAVIPVHGVMAKRMNMFTRVSGGVSTQMLASDLDILANDPAIKSVIASFDTPGGTVDGTPALLAAFRALGQRKRLVAHVDGMMASAGYWVGSAADEIFIDSEVSQVGSIGVVATHVDMSEANAKEGRKVTNIVSGKFKAIESEDEPLSDAGREQIQARCDHIYSLFVRDVAANRGVTVDEVIEKMADGRMFIGTQAIDAGLVDGVSTLPALIDALASGRVRDLMGDGADPNTNATKRRAPTRAKHAREADMNLEALDLNTLQEQRPDLVENIVSRLNTEHEAALNDAVAQAVNAERERIQAIEAHSMPGCEDLINTLKFDPSVTADTAASRVLKHLRETATQRGSALMVDAPRPVPHEEPPSDDPKDFESLVRSAQAAGKSRAEAIKEVVRSHPEAHARYVSGRRSVA